MSPLSHADVFVVSAPSGTGKTTLNRRLISGNPEIEMSVSYTDRAMRPGEKEGVDYHFVSTERFRQLIDDGLMLEFAVVHGDHKGTSLKEIERIRGLGHKVVLEIDVQGFEMAQPKIPGAVSIFFLPPSVEALWKRLSTRGTESPAKCFGRLMDAKVEIGRGHLYQYFIVNEDLDRAYRELSDLILHGKPTAIVGKAGADRCKVLLEEFATAPWIKQLASEMAQD